MPKSATAVLEVGSGAGEFAGICRDHLHLEYIGYEPNKLLCNALNESGLRVHCRKAPPLLEADATQDAVVIMNVIEHLSGAEEVYTLLHESFRVLRGNGVLFVAVPDFLDWGRDFYNLDYTHSYPTTENRMIQVIEDAGFTQRKVERNYGHIFSEFGRYCNGLLRGIRDIGAVVIPKSVSRSSRYQKMGMLFSSNILITARKP